MIQEKRNAIIGASDNSKTLIATCKKYKESVVPSKKTESHSQIAAIAIKLNNQRNNDFLSKDNELLSPIQNCSTVIEKTLKNIITV